MATTRRLFPPSDDGLARLVARRDILRAEDRQGREVYWKLTRHPGADPYATVSAGAPIAAWPLTFIRGLDEPPARMVVR